MPHVIHSWADISEAFSDSILLGNGASIGIDTSRRRSLAVAN